MKDPNEIPRRGSFLHWDGLKNAETLGWQIEDLMPIFEGLATGEVYAEFAVCCARCDGGVTPYMRDPNEARRQWRESEDWMCIANRLCENDLTHPQAVRMNIRIRFADVGSQQ